MPPRKVLPAVGSCVDCLAWGVVGARRCQSCTTLRHDYPGGDGECTGCGRVLALKRGWCRLCWQQAAYESKAAGGLARGAVGVLESGRWLPRHQLFFDRMKLRRNESPVRKYGRRRGMPPKPAPLPIGAPPVRGVQLMLFEVRRDFTRFDESGVDLTNPWLMWGIYLAHRRGEAHGWSRRVRYAVRRGLTIVLSHHAAGDRIRCSELFPAMRARDIGTDRVAEVLQEMGVLHDDRHPAFENWLHRKLDGLAFGIRGDVESWLRTMRDGGPRSRPRDLGSVQNYMNHVRPVLLEWSARYDHLREVTREDILAILTVLHGSHRNNALVGLRRLFTFCRKTRVVFRDPTRGIKVGEHPSGIVQPLDQIEVEQAVDTATTPVARLVLVLAAVHAARKGAIIHLATVFGLDPKTAIRYAENARTLLVTTAEEQEPTGSREPKDRNDP